MTDQIDRMINEQNREKISKKDQQNNGQTKTDRQNDTQNKQIEGKTELQNTRLDITRMMDRQLVIEQQTDRKKTE